ncbi:MAG: mechanosensitive ion channel family protein [Robiginitomaculum sp.]
MDDLQNIVNLKQLYAFTPLIINTLKALGILILGWMFSRWSARVTRKKLGNAKGLEANDTFRPLIATTVKYAIMLAAIYAALNVAGIPASSLLAVFGAAGLAIALALQGTLSNVAAGLMLIFLRSIKVGEYIETSSVEGSVLEIGLFTTAIKDPNGVFVTVPNAQIWSGQIKNYSRFKTRRIDINLEVSRDNDLGAVLKTLSDVLEKQDSVINKHAASVIVFGFTQHGVTLQARCWLKSNNLRPDASKLRGSLHAALRKGGYKLPPTLALKT